MLFLLVSVISVCFPFRLRHWWNVKGSEHRIYLKAQASEWKLQHNAHRQLHPLPLLESSVVSVSAGTGGSRFIRTWIIRIPSLANLSPISAMLICPLNSKFSYLKGNQLSTWISNKPGPTCSPEERERKGWHTPGARWRAVLCFTPGTKCGKTSCFFFFKAKWQKKIQQSDFSVSRPPPC